MKEKKFTEIKNRNLTTERKVSREYLSTKFEVMPSKIYNSTIADYDFNNPQCIYDAIKKRASISSYSYSFYDQAMYQAVVNWYHHFHKIEIKQKNIKFVHGTVNALFQIVQAFTKENDAIIVNNPVYGPFHRCIIYSKRKVINNDLKIINHEYQIDLNLLEKQIVENKVKIYIFCNPHNPVGYAWDKKTVAEIVKICERNNVLLVSDEVHGDLTWDPNDFNSALDASNKGRIIICNSPNKTFNLGGLKGSYLIIEDETVMEQIEEQYRNQSITSPNVFLGPAIIAAYTDNAALEWLQRFNKRCKANYEYMVEHLSESSDINWIKSNCSFIPSFYYQNHREAEFIETCKDNNVLISDAKEFYSELPFIRLNIATQQENLDLMIESIKKVVNKI